MTQENKQLLLVDLCSRLPYGVKVKLKYYDDAYTLLALYTNGTTYAIRDIGYPIETYFEDCKPYLFPLSSMTEEQKIECFKGTPLEINKYGDIAVKDDLYGGSQYTDLEIYLEVINWLLKNHFDIYGLISKNLAIDCTNLNIY